MFLYYRYVDRLHVEPSSWEDLFEFLNYTEADSKIQRVMSDFIKDGSR